MPTHKKNLYELIEYPENVKKRGKPVFIAPLVGSARISKHRCACDNQEFQDDSDSSRGERQICKIERRPESQANVIGYAASQRAFDGMAE
jgi:hypothetical protein